MSADLSHPTSTSLVNRLALVLGLLLHAIVARDSNALPAALGRLSDHLLRDIGVDPRSIRQPAHEAASLDLLQREWP